MKCALNTMATGAECMRQMMAYMAGKWDCRQQPAQRAESRSCWSDSRSDFTDRGDVEASAEFRYSIRTPSSSDSREETVCEGAATIVDAVSADSRFATLAKAVEAADLVETLKQEGPFTVFAPTNEAFDRLPDGTLDALLKPKNKEELADILTYHVVSKKLMAKDIQSCRIKTVNGRKARVVVTAAGAKIGAAEVVETDIKVGNGVIHVIDEVLIPPKAE